MQESILILMPLTDAHKIETLSLAKGHAVCFLDSAKPTPAQLKEATVIIGNPSADDLAQCENLRWLQVRTAGVDMYLGDGILPDSVVLTSASGGYGTAISEYLLAVTLSLCKQLPRYRDQQRQHIWKPAKNIRTVAGSTALVVGSGDIGTQYARKIHALGARVNGIRRHPEDKPDCFEKMGTLDDLPAMLSGADIVALCLPASKQTTGLFNREQFDWMKPGALLLNIGRGVLVDTAALMAALDSGKIAGAALDVTDPEPLPADHPLWDYENVVITPHSAGGEYFGVIYDDTLSVCLANLRRYLCGNPLQNVVEMHAR